MCTEEVRRNLSFFTEASTRGRPVESVVFSGVGAASRDDLREVCAFARERGVRRLTLHAGVEDLDGLRADRVPVDTLVLPLQAGESGSNLAAGARVLARAREIGLATVANTELVGTALAVLPGAARVAQAHGAGGITFTYPFPVEGGSASLAPPPARALAALRGVVPGLVAAGLRVAIRGLPACLLAELSAHAGKTGNRWYVDADHQVDKALLFFPDVVRFHKVDDCRFCTRNEACDGWFANYLRRPGFGRLAPIEA